MAVQWDHVLSSDSYRICLKFVDNVWFVACEGTVGPLQWFEDFDAVMEDVPGIGSVSSGFNVGLPGVAEQLLQIVQRLPWVACGHSRGAAQATLLTGYGVRAGHPPLYRVVFGEPRSCDVTAAKLIGTVPSVSFCNQDGGIVDPVTLVPQYLPPLFPYFRVAPITYLNCTPSADDPWPMPVALHWQPLYQRALDDNPPSA